MQNNVVCLHPFLMSRVVEYHVITVPLGEDREVKMSELFTVFLIKCNESLPI